ncbi:Hypp4029 [Branchiostoma lanceolatum]|uniref:Hypp4029 protein n=1 Tax=Branchiostoma lanceolatum TaxID=7740 RepID=A0A8K0A5E6_BRALA|nr:Hypp4029 [Branchiostoma lanceolatum]
MGVLNVFLFCEPVNGVDGESFAALADADISDLFPTGTTRFILRRKQVRDLVANLPNSVERAGGGSPQAKGTGEDKGAPNVSASASVAAVALQVCPFMLVTTPLITETPVPVSTFKNVVRDQVAVMVTATQQLQPKRWPTPSEVEYVAHRLVKAYPGLGTEGVDVKDAHVNLMVKMKRRLSNIKPVESPRGPRVKNNQTPGKTPAPPGARTPSTSATGASAAGSSSSAAGSSSSAAGSSSSVAATENSRRSSPRKRKQDNQETVSTVQPSTSTGGTAAKQPHKDPPLPTMGEETTEDNETTYTMERHYTLMQKEMGKKNPKFQVVDQLLDLELPARRELVLSLDIESRAATMMQRYPCFSKPAHLKAELVRYVAPSQQGFLEKLREQLPKEAEVLVRYAAQQKILSREPQMASWSEDRTLKKALQVLPQLFKGTSTPPVPLSDMLVVLMKEDGSLTEEAKRAKKRTAFIAVKTTEGVQAFVIIQGRPVVKCASLTEAFLCMMGALYAFQLPHPVCIAPAMVFIEHHIIADPKMNKKDLTATFQKTYKKFKDFRETIEDSSEPW